MNAAGPRNLFRRAIQLLLAALFLSAFFYLVACWFVVNALTTPVRKIPDRTPAEMGFGSARALTLTTRDGVRLRGWLVPSYWRRAVVLVHGIHSNAWDCQAPDLARALGRAGFHVLLFDLRAQGSSAGERLGLGWAERMDVRAAVEYLVGVGFRSGAIGVHETSYGAATTLLAIPDIPEIGAVVADSAFANVRDVVVGEIQRRTGAPSALARMLLPGIEVVGRYAFGVDLEGPSPEQAVERIGPRDVFIIHGEQDPVIPVDSARRLMARSGPNGRLWLLPGRGHTEGMRLVPDCREKSPTYRAYEGEVVRFFDHALSKVNASGGRDDD